MRISFLILVAAIGCGKAPEPKAAPVVPVEFDIGKLKIGDEITKAWTRGKVFDDERLRKKPKLTDGIFLTYPLSCSETIACEGGEILVHYQIDERRLIGVSLAFKSELYPLLVKTYSAKFGTEPHEIITEPVMTKLGAHFDNERAIWQTTSGPFILEKYGSNVEEGFGSLLTPELAEYRKHQDAAEAKALEKRL